MKDYFTMDDFNFRGKVVLVRVDVNSPMDPATSTILDYSRFEAHRQTLAELKDAKVVILAHQSRPGKMDFTPLKAHAEVFTKILNRRVKFVPDLFGDYAVREIENMKNGDYLLLQNTRFYSEEYCLKRGFEHTHIVKELSSVADYFINDAFAAAHRAQTSLIGFTSKMPMIAGRLMDREIKMLSKFIELKEHPKIAVLGGAKVDDSIKVAKNFLEKDIVDFVLTGGVVASVFLIASGVDVGPGTWDFIKREYENYGELIDLAKNLLDRFPEKIKIPVDVVVNKNGKRKGMPISMLPSEYPIFDIGLDTATEYESIIREAKGTVLNGPMGVFELSEFFVGTVMVMRGVAESKGFKVAGGGHTIAALEKYGLKNYFDHVSTGGGSLISFLSGERMPVIEALKESYSKFKSK
ncbi:3-phosphoglycerate kinase [Aciduliprofundum sp. MAR08-339]|uniref:phosphoglycerate kinase n=1 Tax=Aciduliprofundum sp. (strain MAR08-339) TaxID=673860 RepID=UPI0002A4CB54|nr:3-phosphoglycerate kinase [Aciduliprofundum sp. MAR08-339]